MNLDMTKSRHIYLSKRNNPGKCIRFVLIIAIFAIEDRRNRYGKFMQSFGDEFRDGFAGPRSKIH